MCYIFLGYKQSVVSGTCMDMVGMDTKLYPHIDMGTFAGKLFLIGIGMGRRYLSGINLLSSLLVLVQVNYR